MDKGTQRFALYCGLAFPLVFFTGMVLAGFIPPPSPSGSLQNTRDVYAENPTLVRLGAFIMVASAPLQAPLAALIGTHMRRIEGRHSVLAYTEMLLGAVAVVAVLVPVMLLVNIAYRPDEADDRTLQMFHDQAWLMFIGLWSGAAMQNLCIGIAVLRDRRERPVIPHWYGYFSVWVATVFVPGGLIYFFKTGPFAWNGLIAFWVPRVSSACGSS